MILEGGDLVGERVHVAAQFLPRPLDVGADPVG